MLLENVHSLYKVTIFELCGNKGVLIYGIGKTGHELYQSLIRKAGINCIGFYDSNPCGRTHCFGHKIFTRQELEKLDRDMPVVVAAKSQVYYNEIVFDLYKLGFKYVFSPDGIRHVPGQHDIEKSMLMMKENRAEIEKAYTLLEDEKSKYVFKTILKYRRTNDLSVIKNIFEKEHPQYFPHADIFEPDEDEIFIDVGCLDTATIGQLKKWTQDKYKKVYAFEPAHADKIIVDEYITYYGYRAEAIEAGLYNRNGRISFSTTSPGMSTVSENGEETIDVVMFDDFMKDKNEKVTFIKMDIEGSELEALEGSVKTIEKDHPKLAISIYHKFDDLWKIPLWIHKLFPNYKFYIRHHSYGNAETVLYAKYEE